MSSRPRTNSTVRLLYLMAIYPIWKLIDAIMKENMGYIFIYAIVTVFYLAMCIYVARSNYKVKKYYKTKNADNLIRELSNSDNNI
jgi:dolichyl-phosphate-mannose--protein O-mannosyl transferase